MREAARVCQREEVAAAEAVNEQAIKMKMYSSY